MLHTSSSLYSTTCRTCRRAPSGLARAMPRRRASSPTGLRSVATRRLRAGESVPTRVTSTGQGQRRNSFTAVLPKSMRRMLLRLRVPTTTKSWARAVLHLPGDLEPALAGHDLALRLHAQRPGLLHQLLEQPAAGPQDPRGVGSGASGQRQGLLADVGGREEQQAGGRWNRASRTAQRIGSWATWFSPDTASG